MIVMKGYKIETGGGVSGASPNAEVQLLSSILLSIREG